MSRPLPPSDAPPGNGPQRIHSAGGGGRQGRPGNGRRRFLKLALGSTLVAGAGGRLLYEVLRGESPGEAIDHRPEPVTVLEACLGCLGCAILCPTGAIAIAAGGIVVERAKCTRCGYCVAACPVGGVRVNSAGDPLKRGWGR